MALLDWVIGQLADDIPLPAKFSDHPLKGKLRGFRDCHVSPDWVLVYRKQDDGELLLVLNRITSHSNLDF